MLLPAAPAEAEEPDGIDLRPHFSAGRQARYQFWTRRRLQHTTTVGVNERSVERSYAIDGELTWLVREVESSGTATCVLTIDWMSWTLTLPDGTVQVNDSRQPSGAIEPVHDLLRATTGVPLTFWMDADGTVLRLAGTDAIRATVGPDIPIPEDLDYIESATDLAVLPRAPERLQPGGEWPASFEWNHEFGSTRHRMRFALDSVETVDDIRVATVSGAADVELTADQDKVKRALGIPPEGPALRIEPLAGGVDTTVFFDLSRHEAVGRNTVEQYQTSISFELGDQTVRTVRHDTVHGQLLRIEER